MLALILMRRPSGLKPISSRADPSDAAGAFFALFPRFDGLAILHSSLASPQSEPDGTARQGPITAVQKNQPSRSLSGQTLES